MPVDMMPGEYDPANHFMPQQPLHKCMFPKAVSYPTVTSVSNPYEAAIGGVRYVSPATPFCEQRCLPAPKVGGKGSYLGHIINIFAL